MIFLLLLLILLKRMLLHAFNCRKTGWNGNYLYYAYKSCNEESSGEVYDDVKGEEPNVFSPEYVIYKNPS
jgi:hypothetical protein